MLSLKDSTAKINKKLKISEETNGERVMRALKRKILKLTLKN